MFAGNYRQIAWPPFAAPKAGTVIHNIITITQNDRCLFKM